jgi:hypothetical protein
VAIGRRPLPPVSRTGRLPTLRSRLETAARRTPSGNRSGHWMTPRDFSHDEASARIPSTVGTSSTLASTTSIVTRQACTRTTGGTGLGSICYYRRPSRRVFSTERKATDDGRGPRTQGVPERRVGSPVLRGLLTGCALSFRAPQSPCGDSSTGSAPQGHHAQLDLDLFRLCPGSTR